MHVLITFSITTENTGDRTELWMMDMLNKQYTGCFPWIQIVQPLQLENKKQVYTG